jgi:hypothetical protein
VDLTIQAPKVGAPKQKMATLSKRDLTNLIKWHCFMEIIALNNAARTTRTGASGPKGVHATPLHRIYFEGMECDGAGHFCKLRLASTRIRQIDCCAEDDVAGV